MKHLHLLALLTLAAAVPSCSLANKLIQAPIRLIQAAGRTVADAEETTSPATDEGNRVHGVALKASNGPQSSESGLE